MNVQEMFEKKLLLFTICLSVPFLRKASTRLARKQTFKHAHCPPIRACYYLLCLHSRMMLTCAMLELEGNQNDDLLITAVYDNSSANSTMVLTVCTAVPLNEVRGYLGYHKRISMFSPPRDSTYDGSVCTFRAHVPRECRRTCVLLSVLVTVHLPAMGRVHIAT